MIGLVSFSNCRGGAAKAASRIFYAIKKIEKSRSIKMYVVEKFGADPDVVELKGGRVHFLIRIVLFFFAKLYRFSAPTKQSFNVIGVKALNNVVENLDVIHLHWVQNETVSLSSIKKRICKGMPLVITLHDEWFVSGLDHYIYHDSVRKKWISSFPSFKYFIDKYLIYAKRKVFKSVSNVVITAPSEWLVSRARNSVIFESLPIICIPNPIDISIFYPDFDVAFELRKELNIRENEFVILFGAIGGGLNPIKGGHILDKVLVQFEEKISSIATANVRLVSFGGDFKYTGSLNVISVGHVDSEVKLRALYSMANVVIVPSLVEAFGQVAAEAQACATPVLAFGGTGVDDIVQHNISGYLAKNSSEEDMLMGLLWLFSLDKSAQEALGVAGLDYIKVKFNPSAVAKQYLEIYEQLGC